MAKKIFHQIQHWLSPKSQNWILRAPESKPRLAGVSGQIKNPVSLARLSVALAASARGTLAALALENMGFGRTCAGMTA